jgi:hypothetical protein
MQLNCHGLFDRSDFNGCRYGVVTQARYTCANEETDPERTQMTFDLVRIGWPNTAAILALAIMPVVALTAREDQRPALAQFERTEAATICRTCPVIAAAGLMPEIIVE